MVYESAGQEQQKYGDEFPEWRKQMKSGPLARTRRRLAQAHYGAAPTPEAHYGAAPTPEAHYGA